MIRFQKSIATRLALGYGLLLAGSILIALTVLYFGTIGVIDRSIDGKIAAISGRLIQSYGTRPVADLLREIERQMTDGIDSDTEIFLVTSPTGQRLGGNLSATPAATTPVDQLVTWQVERYGKPSRARIIVRQLADGGKLIVGRDLGEQQAIRDLVLRALAAGAAISVILAAAGAVVFRYQLQRRIGDIRRTAGQIEAGDLSRRIPVVGDDEFGRLNVDINRMLNRIQSLMDGVRHVSNAIAHDLRTPLGRIRSKLDEATRTAGTLPALSEATVAAIEGIDDLMALFEKLLQIAEAESGVRTKSFQSVDLNQVAIDMVELYDAVAEQHSVSLKMTGHAAVFATGDHNLLASALASLIDNAIKYAGHGATVEVSALADAEFVALTVRDNGPGIPAAELPRVTERFYRLDHSRNLPGNGLGLSIVSAIAALHSGTLFLENGAPGLIARMLLPAARTSSSR